jgi:hypothetical protein
MEPLVDKDFRARPWRGERKREKRRYEREQSARETRF